MHRSYTIYTNERVRHALGRFFYSEIGVCTDFAWILLHVIKSYFLCKPAFKTSIRISKILSKNVYLFKLCITQSYIFCQTFNHLNVSFQGC